MADTSAGFKYRYRLCGQPPHVQELVAGTAITFYKGDMLIATGGSVFLSTVGSTTNLGACQETVAATAGTTMISFISDDDAVYGVYDASARVMGATLDLSATGGAMTVTTSGSKDFIVVATKNAAADETLVKFNTGHHLFNTAQ